jgi:hypothetical protein
MSTGASSSKVSDGGVNRSAAERMRAYRGSQMVLSALSRIGQILLLAIELVWRASARHSWP